MSVSYNVTYVGKYNNSLLLSIFIFVTPSDTILTTVFTISLALLIIGVERIISGTFSPGKGRRFILGLGILILLVSIMALVLPIAPSLVYLLGIAFFIDSIARVYFGIANRTTSRRSRTFSIVMGIVEIILSLMIMAIPTGGAFSPFVAAIALMLVSFQMMAAGIAGRRLTIAK